MRFIAVITVLAGLCLTLADLAASAQPGDGGTAGGRLPFGCTSRLNTTAMAGSRAGDRVALSFDDGPNVKQTPSILATLNKLDARATPPPASSRASFARPMA